MICKINLHSIFIMKLFNEIRCLSGINAACVKYIYVYCMFDRVHNKGSRLGYPSWIW